MKKCLLLLKRNIHLLKKGELLRPSIFKFFLSLWSYLAKLTARVSRITVIFTCPG
jgi:hypothetical protein